MTDKESQAELSLRLVKARENVVVGARYQHYKQLSYLVTDVALWEATNEACVIYQAEYGDQITFIRPLTNWLETVDVEGVQIPRFNKIDS